MPRYLPVSLSCDLIVSTRKVLAAYSGHCMTVRRSSDDAEMNVGFDSNMVVDIASVLSWSGSDSVYVKTWYDQSGTGTVCQQLTAANQPILINAGTPYYHMARPTVWFDYLLAHWMDVVDLSATQDFTMCCLANWGDDVRYYDQQHIIQKGSGVAGTARCRLVVRYNPNAELATFDRYFGPGTQVAYYGVPTDAMAHCGNASGCELYENTRNIASTANSVSATDTSGHAAIGCNLGTDGLPANALNHWSGPITEIISSPVNQEADIPTIQTDQLSWLAGDNGDSGGGGPVLHPLSSQALHRLGA